MVYRICVFYRFVIFYVAEWCNAYACFIVFVCFVAKWCVAYAVNGDALIFVRKLCFLKRR